MCIVVTTLAAAFEECVMVMQTLPVPAAMLCIFGVLMKLAREPRNIKVVVPHVGPGGCDAH